MACHCSVVEPRHVDRLVFLAKNLKDNSAVLCSRPCSGPCTRHPKEISLFGVPIIIGCYQPHLSIFFFSFLYNFFFTLVVMLNNNNAISRVSAAQSTRMTIWMFFFVFINFISAINISWKKIC